MRKSLPVEGASWESLRAELISLGKNDVDWKNAKLAVYIFNAGEDVRQVARDAYGMYQSENALGPLAFPSLRQMEDDVVSMGLSLLHGPEGACGNMTSGGTESILMAVKTCRDQARAQGRDVLDAELLLPGSAHPAFDKAAEYLRLKTVRVPVSQEFLADVPAMAAAITPRTLMIVGSAPCFPYGLIDPIAELSELALERDLWLHVDACVGGYYAPFARMNGVPVPPFDFELSGVSSVSADLHKYGYCARGASTIFHRSEEQRAHQLFEFDNWAAGGMVTPTAAGSRPGGAVAAAWAVMHYLGVEGYREKTRQVTQAREQLMAGVEAIPGLHCIATPELGIFTYGSDELDIRAVYVRLFKQGWFTGMITEPVGIHLMLSPAHLGVADSYLADLERAVAEVRETGDRADGVKARYA